LNAAARTMTADPVDRPMAPPPAAARRARPAAAVEAGRRQAAADPAGAAAARILSGARPWWFSAPGVMLACANVVLAPVRLAVQVAEAAVALALLAALGVIGAWYLGYVADKDVVAALKPLGQRILAMAQSAGGG
jgi:hypothetical protein